MHPDFLLEFLTFSDCKIQSQGLFVHPLLLRLLFDFRVGDSYRLSWFSSEKQEVIHAL